MIYATPALTQKLRRQLRELDGLRTKLGERSGGSVPWLGRLRRSFRAQAASSSAAIEGFVVAPEEALGLLEGAGTQALTDDELAVAGYARAMDHVATMAEDPGFVWSERVVLDLHFDACGFQRDKRPGLWRTGPVSVTMPDGAGLAFVGPEHEQVPGLMAEVVAWLAGGDSDEHVVVRAAMAHLHVVSVHPFMDGNGRIARMVQSLVLSREGILVPELASIEEYLGRHTGDYYRVLREVQGGSYRPGRDAGPWVAFCLSAHLAQARLRLGQIQQAARRWAALEDLVARRGWPDRLVIALEQAWFGRTDRASYAREAEVSSATASNDLRRLLDAGLLEQHGRGRSAHYRPGPALRQHVTSSD